MEVYTPGNGKSKDYFLCPAATPRKPGDHIVFWQTRRKTLVHLTIDGSTGEVSRRLIKPAAYLNYREMIR